MQLRFAAKQKQQAIVFVLMSNHKNQPVQPQASNIPKQNGLHLRRAAQHDRGGFQNPS